MCKVPHWSKMGRLRRANMPKLGVRSTEFISDINVSIPCCTSLNVVALGRVVVLLQRRVLRVAAWCAMWRSQQRS